jgi:hypothetical protein
MPFRKRYPVAASRREVVFGCGGERQARKGGLGDSQLGGLYDVILVSLEAGKTGKVDPLLQGVG